MEYVIEAPKTENGIRYVPMTDEVAESFRKIIKNRKAPKVEPIIDGYTGFLFLDKNDMPMVALHWEKYMQHILDSRESLTGWKFYDILQLEHGLKALSEKHYFTIES